VRAPLLVTLFAAAAAAGTKGIEFLPKAENALELARTRGTLVFLTVIVDHDAENRAVIEQVFEDAKLRRTLESFACLLANPESDHGSVRVTPPGGKSTTRCADAPTIECGDHVRLAQSYARGFYGDRPVKTPIHFVLDRDEAVVDTIFTGDFETGLHPTPAAELVKRLEALLRKHGRPLTAAEHAKMLERLADARAARARGLFARELEALLAVVALERDVDGVREARARLKEIEGVAGAELEKAKALAAERKWEEAIDAFTAIRQTFAGALAAAGAQRAENEVRALPEVKRLLQAKELYLAGKAFLERGRLEQARKRLEECVRRFPETKYAEPAAQELAKISSTEGR